MKVEGFSHVENNLASHVFESWRENGFAWHYVHAVETPFIDGVLRATSVLSVLTSHYFYVFFLLSLYEIWTSEVEVILANAIELLVIVFLWFIN